MKDFYKQILEKFSTRVFTTSELFSLLSGSSNSRHSFIKRAVANNDIRRIRRGLYCLDPIGKQPPLNLFEIAQSIYGPSYISLESALSYHGWIPERVCVTSSASAKRSRNFETPLGIFSYTEIRAKPFLTAVSRVANAEGNFLIASPWRAIADYVYANKKSWHTLDPLIKSLRIDEESFKETTREELENIGKAFKSRRVRRFVKGIIKELSL